MRAHTVRYCNMKYRNEKEKIKRKLVEIRNTKWAAERTPYFPSRSISTSTRYQNLNLPVQTVVYRHNENNDLYATPRQYNGKLPQIADKLGFACGSNKKRQDGN